MKSNVTLRIRKIQKKNPMYNTFARKGTKEMFIAMRPKRAKPQSCRDETALLAIELDLRNAIMIVIAT